MTMLSLQDAAALIPNATIRGDASVCFKRVWTDSRTVLPGDLFIALSGERFDAHDFLGEVAARGAVAVMVSRPVGALALPQLHVADTRAGLGELAAGWRRRFSLPLVVVTGSNGKTTVKEMIASIFATAVGADARLATTGNMNNDIGLPLTLLRLSAEHRLAVIEAGMNHPGETALLARLANPTVALVNNAQREHQEFMATVEAVALEHASVIHALPRGGIAVFPAADPYAGIWRVAATDRDTLEFALDDEAPTPVAAETANAAMVRGTLAPENAGRVGQRLHVVTPAGEFTATLRIPGHHNARNALAATACALGAGVSLAAIQSGLEAFEPVRGRLRTCIASAVGIAGATVIDDAYNANPDSMRAAIDVLAAAAAPRVLVIGDMGEVGDQGAAFHREIGEYARSRGIEHLFAIGPAMRAACLAYGAGARHFDTHAALLEALLASGLGAGATVLVKGSLFMQMMRIVDALVEPGATRPAGGH